MGRSGQWGGQLGEAAGGGGTHARINRKWPTAHHWGITLGATRAHGYLYVWEVCSRARKAKGWWSGPVNGADKGVRAALKQARTDTRNVANRARWGITLGATRANLTQLN